MVFSDPSNAFANQQPWSKTFHSETGVTLKKTPPVREIHDKEGPAMITSNSSSRVAITG